MEKYQPNHWQLAGGLPNTIHVTEACDDDAPHLITHVETTSAPVVDAAALPRVHLALHGRALLPAVQLVDSGYLDAPQIVAARDDHAIALRGPAQGRLPVAGPRAVRLRARRFPPRLGAGTSDLPGRAD